MLKTPHFPHLFEEILFQYTKCASEKRPKADPQKWASGAFEKESRTLFGHQVCTMTRTHECVTPQTKGFGTMKMKSFCLVFLLVLLAAGIASKAGGAQALPAAPLGTGFTYQGQIKGAGQPLRATCDLRFTLWDAAAAGTQIGSESLACCVHTPALRVKT